MLDSDDQSAVDLELFYICLEKVCFRYGGQEAQGTPKTEIPIPSTFSHKSSRHPQLLAVTQNTTIGVCLYLSSFPLDR